MCYFYLFLIGLSLSIGINSQTIGPCSCDLTVNVCDINCCCDPSCSKNDIDSFTYCSDRQLAADLYNKKLCLPNSLIFKSNAPYILTSLEDLVCLDIDNYDSLNFYQAPPKLTSADVNLLANQLIQQPSSSQIGQSLAFTQLSSYKQDNPIWIFYDNNYISYLALPNQKSGLCEQNEPLTYLNSKSDSCFTREINTCTESVYFDYKQFNRVDYQLLKTPNSINLCSQSNPSSVNLVNCVNFLVALNASCIDATGQSVPCSSPVSNGNTSCDNMVKSVKYTISYENPRGIISANVLIQLISVPKRTKNYEQSFVASFIPFNIVSSSFFKFSGNPGYLFGEPILAGKLNTTLNIIDINSDRSKWLTLPKPSSTNGGTCDINSRASIRFGINLATDCILEYSLRNIDCVRLQSQINSIVNNNAAVDHVGKFGNSNYSLTSDWIRVEKLQNTFNTPSFDSSTVTCKNMILGANILVAYSNIGNVTNPQSIINYIEYSWFTPEDIRYQCVDLSCTSSVWRIRVTTKVTYLNISAPPVSVESQMMKPQAKLPQDFFYPFVLNTNNSAKISISSLLIFFLSSSTFLLIKNF